MALSTVLTRSGAASAYALDTVGQRLRCRGSALGRLGSILARNASKSVSVWPNFSPRPLNAVAIAPSVSLSLAGSILSQHRAPVAGRPC